MENKTRQSVEVVDQREKIKDASKGQIRKKKDIRVSYTNIDGFLSKRLECMDHLRENKPDIMCIVETKLRPNIRVDWFGDGNYIRNVKER